MHWTDCAQNFNNKSFGLRYRGREVDTIVSYNPTGHHFTVVIKGCYDGGTRAGIFDKTIKLIARSPADMSTKELFKVFEPYDFDTSVERISWDDKEKYFELYIKDAGHMYISLHELRWTVVQNMMDIGVYPFQDTKNVIFK